MRIALVAAMTFFLAAPAMAQQSRAPAGFDFNTCYSQCLSRGGSPGIVPAGLRRPRRGRAARAIRRAARANDDPRSSRFHDPEPRRDLH